MSNRVCQQKCNQHNELYITVTAAENSGDRIMLERITPGIDKFYIAYGRTDMRMGINGLINKIQSEFKLNPYERSAFLFCGILRNRIKILLWDGDGFLLMYKRVEKGTFKWPRSSSEAKEITLQQLELLLKGAEIEIKNPIEKVNLRSVTLSDAELDELLA